MATRVLPFRCTIPGGTLITAPVTVPVNLDGWTLEQLDLEVPPGPSGVMGFQVFNNGVAWIPYGAGQWVVWDDRAESYILEDQPNAGGWAVVGYNAGFYSHDVILRAHVSSAVAAAAPIIPTITIVTTPAPAGVPVIL